MGLEEIGIHEGAEIESILAEEYSSLIEQACICWSGMNKVDEDPSATSKIQDAFTINGKTFFISAEWGNLTFLCTTDLGKEPSQVGNASMLLKAIRDREIIPYSPGRKYPIIIEDSYTLALNSAFEIEDPRDITYRKDKVAPFTGPTMTVITVLRANGEYLVALNGREGLETVEMGTLRKTVQRDPTYVVPLTSRRPLAFNSLSTLYAFTSRNPGLTVTHKYIFTFDKSSKFESSDDGNRSNYSCARMTDGWKNVVEREYQVE